MTIKINVLPFLLWPSAVVRYLMGCTMIALLMAALVPSVVKLAVIKLYLWLSGGKKLEVLSGLDAIFFFFGLATFTDPNCSTTINAVARLKGPPDVHQLRQAVKARWVESRQGPKGPKKYPRLTQKVARKFGFYVWEKAENISLDEKVRLHDQGYSDTASLVSLLERAITVPLSMDSPLWECLVIPNVSRTSGGDPDEYAVLLRVHHSMCDGFGCLRMMAELSDEQPIESSTHGMEGLLEKSAFIRSNRFIRFLATPSSKLTAMEALHIVLDAARILLVFPWHCQNIFKFREESHALHLPKKVLSGRKLLGFSGPIDLQLFKDVAKACSCSVNDVYLHLTGRMFARCNEDVSIATDPTVRALFAILVMPTTRWSQNGVTCIGIDLPVHKDTSETGLRIIADSCRKMKSSSMAFTNFLLLHLAGNLLPLPLAKLMLVQIPVFSVISTNLVGPPTSPYVLGAQVTEVLAVPNNIANAGVSFSLLSFAGKVRLGVMVDRVVAPSDQIAYQLADIFVDELGKLHAKTSMENDNKSTMQ